jgi:hypothetical protein
MSATWGNSEKIYSLGVLPPVTHLRHFSARSIAVFAVSGSPVGSEVARPLLDRPWRSAPGHVRRASSIFLPKLHSQEATSLRKLCWMTARGLARLASENLAKEMPASVTSVFSEADDFQATLRADGVLSLLVTGHGQFRARLTQITLQYLYLSAGDEQLSRIAFFAVPADMILVALPIGDRPAPIWGGIAMQAGEMLTFGPGERMHARTDGPCHWGVLRIPDGEVAQYGRALSGAELVVPPAGRWRSPRGGSEAIAPLPSSGSSQSRSSIGCGCRQ